jgi:methionyl-tRNA formyltransferase
MKILFLGNSNSPLIAYLKQQEETVLHADERITSDFIETHQPEFLVSYGYRHILKPEILNRYVERAINLHISFLPWNRGADPNLWSFIENTPKGVTIHYLDNGIDTGDVIVQKQIEFSKCDTLRTSYCKLHNEIQLLFIDNWQNIRSKMCPRKKQEEIYHMMQPCNYIDPTASYHKASDKEHLNFLLTDGWDTPIFKLEEYAAESSLSDQFFIPTKSS